MIKVGDLVHGKIAENGREHYGITSSTSICKITEIDWSGDEDDKAIVILVSSRDYPEYIGHEFEVQGNRMEKIYNKTE